MAQQLCLLIGKPQTNLSDTLNRNRKNKPWRNIMFPYDHILKVVLDNKQTAFDFLHILVYTDSTLNSVWRNLKYVSIHSTDAFISYHFWLYITKIMSQAGTLLRNCFVFTNTGGYKKRPNFYVMLVWNIVLFNHPVYLQCARNGVTTFLTMPSKYCQHISKCVLIMKTCLGIAYLLAKQLRTLSCVLTECSHCTGCPIWLNWLHFI